MPMTEVQFQKKNEWGKKTFLNRNDRVHNHLKLLMQQIMWQHDPVLQYTKHDDQLNAAGCVSHPDRRKCILQI